MAPRLSGQTSIFSVIFYIYIFKSLLVIERYKKLEKLRRNPIEDGAISGLSRQKSVPE